MTLQTRRVVAGPWALSITSCVHPPVWGSEWLQNWGADAAAGVAMALGGDPEQGDEF